MLIRIWRLDVTEWTLAAQRGAGPRGDQSTDPDASSPSTNHSLCIPEAWPILPKSTVDASMDPQCASLAWLEARRCVALFLSSQVICPDRDRLASICLSFPWSWAWVLGLGSWCLKFLVPARCRRSPSTSAHEARRSFEPASFLFRVIPSSSLES